MPRYYGSNNSPTEIEAMKNLCKPEDKEPKRRTLVWRAEDEPAESLRKYLEDSEWTETSSES